ncbi:unnamed protein product [Nezara viridula]|uniref:Uncharacterized protein n=1 Tax=Nezara viridula TaxID=85310 RepID=A0A9P0HG27_NEZVI|nr:unnamed protein product [Nezara viridula]
MGIPCTAIRPPVLEDLQKASSKAPKLCDNPLEEEELMKKWFESVPLSLGTVNLPRNTTSHKRIGRMGEVSLKGHERSAEYIRPRQAVLRAEGAGGERRPAGALITNNFIPRSVGSASDNRVPCLLAQSYAKPDPLRRDKRILDIDSHADHSTSDPDIPRMERACESHTYRRVLSVSRLARHYDHYILTYVVELAYTVPYIRNTIGLITGPNKTPTLIEPLRNDDDSAAHIQIGQRT